MEDKDFPEEVAEDVDTFVEEGVAEAEAALVLTAPNAVGASPA